jgi:50S ribosomal protein L16 3-hydroxylase
MKRNPTVLSLKSLFSPNSIEIFLKHYRFNKPLAVHSKQKDLGFIFNHPKLQSLSVLRSLRHEIISANLPDYNEEYNSITVHADDVTRCIQNRMGITFRLDRLTFQDLTSSLFNLAAELGLPASTNMRSLVYAIPDQGRTAAHYDQNINFILQITGEKTWHIAENKNSVNPLARYTLGTPLDSLTASHSQLPFPSEDEIEFKKIVLKPGSVLFLPRGTWHKTFSQGESLSLNFTYSQPSWAELVSSHIFRSLSETSEWRASAYGLGINNPKLQAIAKKQFQSLPQLSSSLLSQLTFDQIAVENQMAHPLIKFKLNPLLKMSVKFGHLLIQDRKANGKKIKLTDPQIKIAQRLLKQKSMFTAIDIQNGLKTPQNILTIQQFLISLLAGRYLHKV